MQDTAAWREKALLQYPWLLGWKTDVLFLLLPNLFAFALYMALISRPFALDSLTQLIILLYAGNVFHQGATWFHYVDKRNYQYYFATTERTIKYAVIPPLILLLSLVVGYFYWQIVFVVYMIWTVPHFVQQNVGILLLYHNHGQNEAIVPRQLEAKSQQIAGLFFSMLAVDRLFLHGTAIAPFFMALIAVVFCALLVSVTAYLFQLLSQVKKGAYINVPALLFWLASIMFFLPFAYVSKDPNISIIIPSLLHWIQYIALNYVLVKRKYAAEERKADLPSAKPMLFFLVFCSVILCLQFGPWMAFNTYFADKINIWISAFLGLGMVHYWIDGLIWKFRDPFIRSNTLPFIVRPKPTT
ncbi:MAG TPA: hypothetical protein V6D17_13750 [Candidatus Obscuribacterales bacterium]